MYCPPLRSCFVFAGRGTLPRLVRPHARGQNVYARVLECMLYLIVKYVLMPSFLVCVLQGGVPFKCSSPTRPRT